MVSISPEAFDAAFVPDAGPDKLRPIGTELSQAYTADQQREKLVGRIDNSSDSDKAQAERERDHNVLLAALEDTPADIQ